MNTDYDFYNLKLQGRDLRKRVQDMQGRIAKTDNFSINLSPSRCEVRFKPHEQSKYMRELFGFGGKNEKENLTELHKRLTVFAQELQSLVEQVEKITNKEEYE